LVADLRLRIIGVPAGGPEPNLELCNELRDLDLCLKEPGMQQRAMHKFLDVILSLDEAYRGGSDLVYSLKYLRRNNPDSIFMRKVPC
jgi:hypothetical protein